MNKVLAVVGGIAGLAALAVGGVLAAASAQPDTLEVSRSVTMSAAATDVVPHIVDFEKFVEWSPWSALDPNQTVTYSDPPRGVGAWYRWKGNDDVGEGEMRVVSVSKTRILMDLEFITPFAAKAKVPYKLTETDDTVTVEWGYRQQQDFMGKTMGLFLDMDSLLGADFERGLASLKQVVEADAKTRREAEAVQDVTVSLQGTFVYKGATQGVRRVEVRGADGATLAARKISGKSWSVEVPNDAGVVRVVGFVDAQRDGLTQGDPGAASGSLTVATDDIAGIELRLADDFDAASLAEG